MGYITYVEVNYWPKQDKDQEGRKIDCSVPLQYIIHESIACQRNDSRKVYPQMGISKKILLLGNTLYEGFLSSLTPERRKYSKKSGPYNTHHLPNSNYVWFWNVYMGKTPSILLWW